MFIHSFQQGTHFEVFDPKEVGNKVNKEKAMIYKNLFKPNIPQKVTRVFLQELKGFIYELEGFATKLQLPKTGDLGLISQYLVLQVYIYEGYNWTLELDVTDITNTKRRIVLTDSVKNLEQHFFHVKSPIDLIRRGQWINLCIDVWSFMEAFKGCTFRSLDVIIIGSPCKLRKIYIMKYPIEDSEIEITYTQGFALIPKQVNFPEYFAHGNQLITFRLLNHNEFILSQQNYADQQYIYDLSQKKQNPIKKLGKFKYSKVTDQSLKQYSQKSKGEFQKYENKSLMEKIEQSNQNVGESFDSEFKDNQSYFEEVQNEYEQQKEEKQYENQVNSDRYRNVDDEDDGEDDGEDEDEEYLNLVYDPKLQCFFDPETNEYYQLNQ